jgi:hypothetical protein
MKPDQKFSEIMQAARQQKVEAKQAEQEGAASRAEHPGHKGTPVLLDPSLDRVERIQQVIDAYQGLSVEFLVPSGPLVVPKRHFGLKVLAFLFLLAGVILSVWYLFLMPLEGAQKKSPGLKSRLNPLQVEVLKETKQVLPGVWQQAPARSEESSTLGVEPQKKRKKRTKRRSKGR